MFDPAQYHALTGDEAVLVRQIVKYTEAYFQDPKFDASHDFNHVLRVTGLAIKILEKEQPLAKAAGKAQYHTLTVVLGALLHDVDDRKYRAASTGSMPAAQAQLTALGVPPSQAARVQMLIDGVSYSSEIKNPQRVRDLLITIPELAIVQDADRLDAIGAIGAGRCFAYGAAKTSRDLGSTMEHFDEKLFKLQGMMKTATGHELSAKYTARLQQFQTWWWDEIEFAGSLP